MKRTFLTLLPLILFYCVYHIVVMAGVGGGGVGSSPAVGSGSSNVSEFNATNYGAKSDGKLVTGVTTTATLATVTISGLTALDVGKDISIYTAATQSGSIYTGTISTVSGSTVTLSPGTVDASVAGTAVAKICTDDTTAIQAALDAVGDTTILRSGVVKVSQGATCISSALNVHGSVEFAGQGLSRASTSTPLGTQIWWMGTGGGSTTMLKVDNSADFRVHDMALIGNSRSGNEPNDIIQITQSGGSGSITSFGQLYNLSLGGAGWIGDPENGNYPNGTIAATAEHCINAKSTGTQTDRHTIRNVSCNLGHEGILIGQAQAVEWTIEHFTCNNCGTGFDDYIGGGAHTLINYETLNTALPFAIGQGAYITAINHSEQNSVGGTPGNACTLSSVFGDTNCRLVSFKGTGGTPGGTLHLIDSTYAAGVGLTSNFAIVTGDASNTGDWRFIGDNFRVARDPGGPPTSPFLIDMAATAGAATSFQFTCRNCQGLDPLQNIKVPASYSDPRGSTTIDMCPIESGTWNSTTTGTTSGFSGYCMRNLLRGTTVAIDPAREDLAATFSGLGSLKVIALTPNNPAAIGSASTCATAGAASYFYKFTYKDALGNEGLPSAQFNPVNLQSCATTVSGTNTISIQLNPLPGASEVCVYRSDTGGPDGGGSNGEKKLTMTGSGSLADGCISMNFMNQFGGANNKITDTIASNSGGVSVPTTDATGQVVAVSSKLTATTVATLPSTCTAGQVRAVTDWNGTNGACTGGGANYTTATCGAANNWFCP